MAALPLQKEERASGPCKSGTSWKGPGAALNFLLPRSSQRSFVWKQSPCPQYPHCQDLNNKVSAFRFTPKCQNQRLQIWKRRARLPMHLQSRGRWLRRYRTLPLALLDRQNRYLQQRTCLCPKEDYEIVNFTSLELKNALSFPICLVLERPRNSEACFCVLSIWLQLLAM
jgi:hypothetical protein